MIYNKLVRDKIPQLIEAQGERPVVRQLEQQEYVRCLEAKLDEEVGEYHRDKNIEELADIMEVLVALAAVHGATEKELLCACHKKRDRRGGFMDRVYLVSKEPESE